VNTDVTLLPPGATATELVLPDGLPYEDWARLGHALGRMDRAVQFWLGDWLMYGEHTYGEKFAQAASETGLSEEKLKQCQWVASRFTRVHSRRAALSFTHHRAVAGLEPEMADAMLLQAEVEGLSSAELGRRVKQANHSVAAERRCECCGQRMPAEVAA
jgi:hypothetical protein